MRRDLLLRHDRTVHAKDGGIPLVAEGRRRGGKAAAAAAAASPAPWMVNQRQERQETGKVALRPLYPAGYRPRAGRFTLPVRRCDFDTAARQVTKASSVRPDSSQTCEICL